MDLAYDHIQEDAYPKDQPEPKNTPKPEQTESTLNKDFQDAYKAFSSSPWGARLGGFLGNVVKQGGEVYTQAQKELAEVSEDAQKGFSGLRDTIISRTRALSVTTGNAPAQSSKDADDGSTTPTRAKAGSSAEATGDSENYLSISKLKSEAAKRLEELRRAEDAADDALLKFGVGVRDFLKEAISVAPPQGGSEQGSTVLFESKDAQGKRVIHTSRFDAQLHVIHTSTESFSKEPTGPEYEKWVKEFDIDKKTADIEVDLKKYPELRATMEKLVPTQIPYADFWQRYYFLRHGIETAEARRRDLLKAASAEEQVGWGDDDSDSESDDETTPAKPQPASAASSTTIHPPAKEHLKPAETRKSNDEKSQADSEASYDVVGAASGKTSQAPSSPKDSKKEEEDSSEDSDDEDDSSDEDWE